MPNNTIAEEIEESNYFLLYFMISYCLKIYRFPTPIQH